jgi:hypothetical protein
MTGPLGLKMRNRCRLLALDLDGSMTGVLPRLGQHRPHRHRSYLAGVSLTGTQLLF